VNRYPAFQFPRYNTEMPKISKCIESVIILGLGSIGKAHLERVLGIAGKVFVVDPSLEVRTFIENHQQADVIRYFSSLEDFPKGNLLNVAIISNWGPDHFKTFNDLEALGVKKFLIEKPLVTKVSDFLKIKEAFANPELFVGVNMPWLEDGLKEQIFGLRDKYLLGAISNISISGGAKCLSTIGIHYIGLACLLFECDPIKVTSLIESQRINPRSPSLDYLAGTASWNFGTGRYLQMCFSNSSHNQATAIVNFEFGRMQIDGPNIRILSLSQLDRENIDKPTRTFYPTEVHVESKGSPGVTTFHGTDVLIASVIEEVHLPSLSIAVKSTEALLAMLIANKEERAIAIPINDEMAWKYMDHEWNVS
jgi:predicted dehydrogenase